MLSRLRYLILAIITLVIISQPTSGQNSQQVWTCISEIGQVAIIDSIAFTVDLRFNVTMGVFPWAIAFTPDGKWAYIVCRDSNNVIVVNTTSLEEETTIEVGGEPFDIEITASGAAAFVTNNADGTVSVISTTTGNVDATVEVGNGPRDLALSRDGKRAYICLSGEDSVAVINTNSLSIERKIPAGRGPWGVDVTTDDRRLYVSCHDEDLVYAIDLNTDETVKKIEVNEGPRSVSVIPDAQRVYVPCIEAVAIIDANQNSKIDASGIHGAGWQGTVRPDGAYIFVSTVDHEGEMVEVIDISRMEKIETIWLGDGNKYPRGIAIKPLLSSGRVSTSITCLGPENVEINTTIDISGSISPPLEGREVTLVYRHPDVSIIITREVTTDSYGAFNDSYSPQRKGKWEVTASWEGDEKYLGSSSPVLSFSADGGSTEGAGPLPLIIIIAIVIIVALVLRRRGRKNP